MKRTYSNPDLEKFYYNKFNANDRKDWLNKFGGIKVFPAKSSEKVLFVRQLPLLKSSNL
jgi:hypothetical protein